MQFIRFSPPKSRPMTLLAGWKPGRWLLGLAVAIWAGESVALASENKVTLEWNRNPEKDVAGYEIRYHSDESLPPRILNVGNKIRFTLTGLEPDTTYAIAIRAYDRSGLRSRFSREIRHTTPPVHTNRAPDTRILTPDTGGTVVTGHPVVFSAAGTDPDGENPTIRWNFGASSGISDIVGTDPGAVRFQTPGTYRVTATAVDARGLADASPASLDITVLPAWELASREGWALRYVNSEERAGYAATQAFDGDSQTFWHTGWISGSAPPPHIIELDLGTTRHIKGFQYLPRQDGFKVGAIGRYAFHVSADGVDWGKPIASGTFDGTASEKRVLGSSKKGRYVRLVSLSEAYGNLHCSIAELNVLSGPPPNRRPKAASRTVTCSKNKPITLALRARDPDGNPLTCRILEQPLNGTLSGRFPNLIYRPDRGFTGTDLLTFAVHDGLLDSRVAKIRIQVKPPANGRKQALSALSREVSPGRAQSVSTAPASGGSSKPETPVRGNLLIDGRRYLTLTAEKTTGRQPVIEVSSDLVKWFSGERHTTTLIDDGRILKVRDNTPLHPGGKRFIRVRPATR
jgi:chitodextrinase